MKKGGDGMAERKAVYNPAADRRWAEANRDRRNYLSKRSSARSFIRNWATEEDLDELAGLIDERRAIGEKTTAQDAASAEERQAVDQ